MWIIYLKSVIQKSYKWEILSEYWIKIIWINLSTQTSRKIYFSFYSVCSIITDNQLVSFTMFD